MNPQDSLFVSEREESKQAGRILSLLIWASWGIFLFVLVSGLYFNDRKLIAVILAGSALLIVPLVLLKCRYLQASSLVFVLITLGSVTTIATVGQGIRDLAIITFPIVFIFAGLMLKRAFFRLCVGLTFAAVCWLVFGESNGWFVTIPFNGNNSNWFYLLGVIIILLLAALAVDLLATNMRKNLAHARQEIAQRKQAEDGLREKEIQYHNLADSGIALIWTSGTDKLCNYFNLPWLKFTGRTLEQEMGNGWADGVHPEDFDRCLATYMTAFEKREPFEMDYRLRHSSGEYRWIQDIGTPNRNSSGEFIGYIGHCFDITDRKHSEEEVKNSGKRFHALIEHGRDNISLLAVDGTLLWESPSAYSTLGYAFNQFVGNNIFELMHPDDQAWIRSLFMQVIQTPGNIQEGLFRLLHADGTWRWIECSANNLLNEPNVQAIVLNYRDITLRKQAEEALRESEERFKLSMDATNDGLWDWNIKTDGGYFSPGYYRMLGYEVGDFPVEGKACRDLIHPDDRERVQQVDMDCIEGRCEYFEVEFRMKARNGEWRWILGRGKCVARDEQGRATRLVGTHIDLTERKRVEDLLHYQSTYDVMTGIYNRNFFEEEFARLDRGREFPVSIIIADIDGLKAINDTLGHTAGDELLRQAANVLRSVFRAEEILARIGGDEFAALLPGTDAATAERMVSRIQERLMAYNTLHPDIPVCLSLGAATAEKGNLAGTFTLADQRMYADKTTRKSSMNHALAL